VRTHHAAECGPEESRERLARIEEPPIDAAPPVFAQQHRLADVEHLPWFDSLGEERRAECVDLVGQRHRGGCADDPHAIEGQHEQSLAR
jgi:hypothetical protein